jgi:hypothetical protein
VLWQAVDSAEKARAALATLPSSHRAMIDALVALLQYVPLTRPRAMRPRAQCSLARAALLRLIAVPHKLPHVGTYLVPTW